MEPITDDVEALDAIRRVVVYLDKIAGGKDFSARKDFRSMLRSMCHDLLEAGEVNQDCCGCPLCGS